MCYLFPNSKTTELFISRKIIQSDMSHSLQEDSIFFKRDKKDVPLILHDNL